MPEYPDIVVYVERLLALLGGRTLEAIRLRSPFLLRTVEPKLAEFEGRVVQGFSSIGKRIVWHFEGDLHLVFHLMIAGRLRWRKRGAAVPKKRGLLGLDFAHGTLLMTEEGTQKRAKLHAVAGHESLAAHDPGGLDVLHASREAFASALTAKNHTLKRAMTDPRILSGIGNAYSDEILFQARLSPLKTTSKLSEEELTRLYEATREGLLEWAQRLRDEVGEGFPEKVTAFRPEMAVHGRYKQPCPVCGSPVQRIAYATKHEVNYCAQCQNQGRVLADRSLSRLLKKDWPRTLEELEERGIGGTSKG